MGKTIGEYQAQSMWGAHTYSDAFRADPRPHKDAAHAVLHIQKATGKVSRAFRAARRIAEGQGVLHPSESRAAGRYLADVVICAARVANTWPTRIDLAAAFGEALLTSPPQRAGDVPVRRLQIECVGADADEARSELIEAGGDLAEAVDDHDHTDAHLPGKVAAALVRLVVSALELATSWPGGAIDVEDAVAERLAGKGIGPADAAAAS